jgi:hypothetical protein
MRAIILCISSIVLCSNFFSVFSLERGYGDWPKDYPMHPSMRERRVLVLTNACRFSPQEYRDTYLVPFNSLASDILLPQNYPATYALYWQTDLNRVAKVHAVDMANNHGMSHTSSDGTSCEDRIKSYYKKGGWWGENIATGGQDAFRAMRQWLLDIIDYVNDIPAPDNSGDDGHRKNIMTGSAKEIGIGYAYGPIEWYHFWVQDFGGKGLEYNNPISAGAHFVLSGNETQFMCTYTDPNNSDPQGAEVVIDNQEHNLNVLFGEKKKGTYDVKLTTAGDCRYYYFKFVDSQGNAWRHPEFGRLVTLGEGTCEEEYEFPDEIIFSYKKGNANRTVFTFRAVRANEIILGINGKSNMLKYCSIINCKGQEIQRHYLSYSNSLGVKTDLIIPLKHSLSSGVYFLTLYNNDNKAYIVKIYVSDM